MVESSSQLLIRQAFAQSYGCMTTVLSYFEDIDKLKLQQLSAWWYETGVARV